MPLLSTLSSSLLKVFKAQPFDDEEASGPDTGGVGCWYTDGRTYLRVQTANGLIDLLDVQLEGKKRMFIADFLRGFNVEVLKS